MNFVKGPPNGLVLSGAADDFGWLHDNGLDDYPTRVFPSNDAHNCGFGADYTLSTVTAPGGGVIQSGGYIRQLMDGSPLQVWLRCWSRGRVAIEDAIHVAGAHWLTRILAPSSPLSLDNTAIWVTAGDEYGACR